MRLKEYMQKTSTLRVVAVCALTPLPALCLAVFCECIPLQNPADGWKKNYGAWVRVLFFTAVAASGSLFQVRASAPQLTLRKIFLIVVVTTLGSVASLIVLAAVWAFPIPFAIVVMSCPFQALITILFLASIRTPGSKLIPDISAPLQHKIYLVIAQSGLAFVYILFSIAFARCTTTQQFGLLVLLPIMKLSFKHFVARLAADNKETIPVVVVFTVDALNGFYTSVCIQTSRSWWASAVMVVLNMIHTIISLREVGHESRALEALERQSGKSKTLRTLSPDKGRRQSRPSLNLIPNNRIQAEGSSQDSSGPRSVQHLHRQSQDLVAGIAKSQAELAQRSRRLLFRLEYLVLVKYTESIVPTLYALYLFILFYLPSAKYYPLTRSLTTDQLQLNIGSIMTYVLAEILSIVWLHAMVKRRFGFSLLYQLSFVLETEVEPIQSRLTVWIIPMLQFTLVHYGADFSLRFAWLNATTVE